VGTRQVVISWNSTDRRADAQYAARERSLAIVGGHAVYVQGLTSSANIAPAIAILEFVRDMYNNWNKGLVSYNTK
jgi:hypothetical protein